MPANPLDAQLERFLFNNAESSPTQHIIQAIAKAGDKEATMRWLLEQVRDRYEHGQTTRNRLAKLAGALHRANLGPTKEELAAIEKSLHSHK